MAYTTEVDEKFMPKESGAINGGIMKRNPTAPSPTIAVTVASLNEALEKIMNAGGTVLTEVLKVGDMGLYAYIKDTEGNVIGVWQNLKQ
jgi:predicted enzyme related to lactoylglutathione lyase